MSGNWLALDWGTSNVRLWAMQGSEVTGSAQSDNGMSRLSPHDYPVAFSRLAEAAGAGSDCPAVVCGMAGARGGWAEAGYVDVPCPIGDILGKSVEVSHPERLQPIRLLPGLCRREHGHEDVIRGEETQLFGLMALNPDFAGTVVMPGTHSKWADLSAGRITRFATAMTGELYELLVSHSVLRLTTGEPVDPQDEENGTQEGLDTGIADPALATTGLFRARAAALLSGKPAGWCRGWIGGLLVGAEVGARTGSLAGQTVAIVGSDRLTRLYSSALKKAGATPFPVDAEQSVLAGLIAAATHQGIITS